MSPRVLRFPLFPLLAGACLAAGPWSAAAQGPSGTIQEGSDGASVVVPLALVPEASLRAGDVLILASWRCSYLQLERVNELALSIVEAPLSRAVDQGRLRAWGQFNGEFRDEYNYHTFYIASSVEQYRQVMGSVLRYMNEEAQAEMQEFYRLCDATREVTMTVVTARQ